MNKRIVDVSNKVIFFGLLILVCFLPLVFNPNFQDAFTLPKVTFSKVMVSAMFLAWLVKMIETRTGGERVRLVRSSLNLPILLFLLSSTLATIFSINPRISFQGMYMYRFSGLSSVIIYVLIYFVVINNLTRDEVGKVILAIFLGSGLVALYGILQHLGIDFFKWNRSWEERVWSTFGNPNFLSAYLVMVIPLALSILIKKHGILMENDEKPRNRTLLLVFLGSILFIALLCTLSRAGWLGFSGSLIAFVLLVGKEALVVNKKRLIPIFLIFVLSVGIYVLPENKAKSRSTKNTAASISTVSSQRRISSAVAERVESVLQLKEYGIVTRIMAWKAILEMIKHRPLLGTGLDTVGLNFRRYMSPEYARIAGIEANPIYAHNEILQTTSTMGLVGLGIYLWLLITFFGKGIGAVGAFRNRRETSELEFSYEERRLAPEDLNRKLSEYLLGEDDRILVAGLLSSCTGLLIQNQFSFSMVTTSVFFWLFMGLVTVLSGREMKREEDGTRIGEVEDGVEISTPPTSRGMRARSMISLVKQGSYLLIFIATLLLVFLPASRCYLADGHFKKGLIAEEKGLYDEAISEITRAIALNSDESAYHQRLARVHQEIGAVTLNREKKIAHLAIAIEEFKKYITAIPQDAMGYSGLGTTYIYAGRDINREFYHFAVENFKKAIEMDPFLVDAYVNLGTAYCLQGRAQDAIKILNDGLEINVNEADLYFNLGMVYALEKDNEKAGYYWNKTLDLDPNNVDARNGLAQLEEIEEIMR